jgi:hypothetical protein
MADLIVEEYGPRAGVTAEAATRQIYVINKWRREGYIPPPDALVSEFAAAEITTTAEEVKSDLKFLHEHEWFFRD